MVNRSGQLFRTSSAIAQNRVIVGRFVVGHCAPVHCLRRKVSIPKGSDHIAVPRSASVYRGDNDRDRSSEQL